MERPYQSGRCPLAMQKNLDLRQGFRRSLDASEQFPGTHSDKCRLILGQLIALRQDTLDSFVKSYEVEDLSPYRVHATSPYRPQNFVHPPASSPLRHRLCSADMVENGDDYSARSSTTFGSLKVCIYLLSQRFRNIRRYWFLYFNWLVVNGHD